MKNSKVIMLVISVVLLTVLTFSITYSYFSSNKVINNTLSINMTTSPGSYTFVVDSSDNLDFDLKESDFYTNNISNESVALENSSLIVSLKSPDFLSTTICRYDAFISWDSVDQYINSPVDLPFVKDDVSYNYQMSLQATKSVNFDTSNFIYTDENYNETDLSKLSWSKEEGEIDNTAYLFTGQIASRSTEPTVATWNFTGKFYNIPIDQNFWAGKTLIARIYIDNVKCGIFSETPESIDLLETL